jgi:hypothetical protein
MYCVVTELAQMSINQEAIESITEKKPETPTAPK